MNDGVNIARYIHPADPFCHGFHSSGCGTAVRSPDQATDCCERHRQRHREADHLDDHLHDIDDRRRLQASGSEIRGDDGAAQSAAGSARQTDHGVEEKGDAKQLTREDCERADPQQRGNRAAHPPIESPLEKVANRVEVVCCRQTADAGTDEEGQHEGAQRRGADPPGGADAVLVGDARCADR